MEELKIVLLGAKDSGKGSVAYNFIQDKHNPTTEDHRKLVEVDGKKYTLEILDTTGTETFTAMSDLYMKNGDGFILMFRVTSKFEFDEVIDLRQQILRVRDCNEQISMILVGTDCHLSHVREISEERAIERANEFNCPYMECSHQERLNINEIFYQAVREIVKRETIATEDNTKKDKKTLSTSSSSWWKGNSKKNSPSSSPNFLLSSSPKIISSSAPSSNYSLSLSSSLSSLSSSPKVFPSSPPQLFLSCPPTAIPVPPRALSLSKEIHEGDYLAKLKEKSEKQETHEKQKEEKAFNHCHQTQQQEIELLKIQLQQEREQRIKMEQRLQAEIQFMKQQIKLLILSDLKHHNDDKDIIV